MKQLFQSLSDGTTSVEDVLDLVADGKVQFGRLMTHRVD